MIADVRMDIGEVLAAELGKGTRFQETDVTSRQSAERCIETAVRVRIASRIGELRGNRAGGARCGQSRAARTRLVFASHQRQPDRHVQHDCSRERRRFRAMSRCPAANAG